MVERTANESRHINAGPSRGMTFGDYFNVFGDAVRPVAVHALWLAQDDPKKNTAVLASKRGNLTLHKSIRSIPERGIS